jgi:2-phospho-L-lactate guanylyltransferase (CobY/MobA/RfbA family)
MTEATTADLQAAIEKQNRIIQSLIQQRNKALDDVVVMQADLAMLQEQVNPTNGNPSPDSIENPDGEDIE